MNVVCLGRCAVYETSSHISKYFGPLLEVFVGWGGLAISKVHTIPVSALCLLLVDQCKLP